MTSSTLASPITDADHVHGSVVARLVPAEAPYVKAFGTLGATDDDKTARAVERLISAQSPTPEGRVPHTG